MPCALKISEAAALAMHAMALLGTDSSKPLSTRAIASAFRVSEAHLSKVMQRLVKVGLLRSERGPKGGFSLAREPGRVTLLQVFEAIEGPMEDTGCMFRLRDCDGRNCILGRVLVDANQMLFDHLSTTNLKDIGTVFAGRDLMIPLQGGEPQGE